MRAIRNLAHEPSSVTNSSRHRMRATRREERRPTPTRRGTPDSMTRSTMTFG
jgi:hypothetical protein